MADLIKTIEDDEEVPDLSEPSDEEDDVRLFNLSLIIQTIVKKFNYIVVS